MTSRSETRIDWTNNFATDFHGKVPRFSAHLNIGKGARDMRRGTMCFPFPLGMSSSIVVPTAGDQKRKMPKSLVDTLYPDEDIYSVAATAFKRARMLRRKEPSKVDFLNKCASKIVHFSRGWNFATKLRHVQSRIWRRAFFECCKKASSKNYRVAINII